MAKGGNILRMLIEERVPHSLAAPPPAPLLGHWRSCEIMPRAKAYTLGSGQIPFPSLNDAKFLICQVGTPKQFRRTVNL